MESEHRRLERRISSGESPTAAGTTIATVPFRDSALEITGIHSKQGVIACRSRQQGWRPNMRKALLAAGGILVLSTAWGLALAVSQRAPTDTAPAIIQFQTMYGVDGPFLNPAN